MKLLRTLWPTLLFMWLIVANASATSIASSNIPLDSRIYSYLEKLSGFGLITSDVKGIKPFSKAEAARLLLEAEQNLSKNDNESNPFARQLVDRVRDLIPRELYLLEHPDEKPQFIDYNLLSALRLRYAYLDGAPRNYERLVHDPGNDGVFGIGSGLRPPNPPSSTVTQRGSEGTPLSENNDGINYRNGDNGELRWAAEGYVGSKLTALIEPVMLVSGNSATIKLNRGYLKIGGGALELEVGKDENWLGQGYRGNITLTNNAENLGLVKLSSPEPFRVGWLSWLGDLKYTLIASRLDNTVTDGQERQPWFYAMKITAKPTDNLEIGFNLGRQVGGPGVSNGIAETLHGIIGGTNSDNSNGLAGFEVRYRVPWLRNTEFYGEFSGEDTASFWPIVESYVAGFYIPRLTENGRNDFRFEFFQGNQILYTNGTFPEGYIYKGMPLGHSQGGATQDFFSRYSHWFSVRNNLALEYFYTNRGMIGRVPGQAIERKHAGRISWTLPVYGDLDALLLYGAERITNLNLVEGSDRTNQLFIMEFSYRY